jgi:hypothetical protein
LDESRHTGIQFFRVRHKKSQERNEKNKSTIYKYTLNHCVALKSEDDAPAAGFSWPHLVIVPKAIRIKAEKK